MSFFEELKRRNVFRVGIAYGVAAWVILQVADLVLDNINAPDWVIQAMMLMVGLGFIAALVIAWAYEMTPEGIRRETDVDRSNSIVADTGKKLDRIVIGFLVVAIAVLLYRQSLVPPVEHTVPSEPTVTKPVVTESPAPGIATTTSDKKSVAVLPFVNMSSDPEQEYFSDGLSEELLNRLAKNDQLHVAARTSAFQFKGQNLDITDIGRQLHVAHVLEGSVRKAGNRLRITAQLIQVDNGFHLWSETYEREVDDIFAIQDDISQAISRALEIELGTAITGANTPEPTSNLEAYNIYLQARYFLAQRGEDNMLKANELFEQAVELDPGFSSAWSGMAFNNSLLWSYSINFTLEELLEKTLDTANRAIELEPSNAEAYTAIAHVLTHSFDFKAAQENFERAYALGPNDVGVMNLYADFLFVQGNPERAISLTRQIINLDPLSAIHAHDLAQFLLGTGRFEEALVSARRSLQISGGLVDRVHMVVTALLRSGLVDEAKSLIESTMENSQPNDRRELFIAEWWASYYYLEGDIESLRRLVAENGGVSEAGDYPRMGYALLAFYSLWMEGVEAALPWLDKAYEIRDGLLIWPQYFYLPERISDDPAWLAFWTRPGLSELIDMRRANVHAGPEYWKPRPDISEATP